MKWKIAWVWVAFVSLAGACGAPAPDDGGLTGVGDSSAVITTPIAAGDLDAGGPCLDDRGNRVGESGIQVSWGEQTVDGSFGHDSIGYCPGHPEHGGRAFAGDGFFMDLASTLLDVEPGDELVLSARGYPGATVDVSWSVDNVIDSSTPAVLTPTSETTWLLYAPDDAELYLLSVHLEWLEGDASYAVLVTTGGSLPLEGGVTSIVPTGDPYTHPTVVPIGFIQCGESPLRFCDPERDLRWFEVETQVGSPVPEWQLDSADRLRGAIKVSEAPRTYGIYVGPSTLLTVTATGVDHLALIATIESIPAFDSELREAECAATPPENLPDYSWKCDLTIRFPESSETDLTRFVEIVGPHQLGYAVTPDLPGGPTPRQIITYGPGDPWEALTKWKDDMVRASDELGFDPSPVTDGTYLVEDVILFVYPETPESDYLAALSQLHDAGFTTEMVLRERY